MTIKIESKITGWSVAKKVEATLTTSNSPLKRSKRLGNTWRLKPSYAEHAIYVTIECIEQDGKKHPYEIFFHGKDTSHRMWTDAFTLAWSTLFRKAYEHSFSLTDSISNLKDTSSVSGGYRAVPSTSSKSVYYSSIIAEIGACIEEIVSECESSHKEKGIQTKETLKCPECGSVALREESGCLTCFDCGYSKCS